jgi:hypothetical protein
VDKESGEPQAAKRRVERAPLEAFVEQGMTIAEIAGEVNRSTGTVRRLLARYGLRTKGSLRRVELRAAKESGLASVVRSCARHGETEFAIEGRGYYRCKQCRAEGVARRRRRLKEILVAEAGGECCICGYDRYIGALEFHHVDPGEKRLGLAAGGLTLSLDALRAEARKCVLVCSNCHAEVEGGTASLPDTVSTTPPEVDRPLF